MFDEFKLTYMLTWEPNHYALEVQSSNSWSHGSFLMNVDSKSNFDSYDLKGLNTLREAHDMSTFKKIAPSWLWKWITWALRIEM
jgi:hypothetical protein